MKNNLNKSTLKLIKKVKNYKNKSIMQIAREAKITLEAVESSLNEELKI